MPLAKLSLGSAAAVLGAGAAVCRSCARYARARLTSFLEPVGAHAPRAAFRPSRGRSRSDPAGCSASGRVQSVQKIFYLPEAQTDFILAVIGEELGVVGVLALMLLYGLIALAGLRARARAPAASTAPLIAVGVTVADRLAGAAQHVRGARPRAADRRAAAVRLLRLEQPDRDARRDGPAAQRGRAAATGHVRARAATGPRGAPRRYAARTGRIER